MPTPTSTALAIVEQLVTIIDDWWDDHDPDRTANDTVGRAYLIDQESAPKMMGRKILVAPDEKLFEQTEESSRARSTNEYPVYVMIGEICRDSDPVPSLAWVDKRVKFYETLLKFLGEIRRNLGPVFTGDLANVEPVNSESIVGVDWDELRSKRYWALMLVTFRRRE